MDGSTLLTGAALLLSFFLFGSAIRQLAAGDPFLAALNVVFGALVLVWLGIR